MAELLASFVQRISSRIVFLQCLATSHEKIETTNIECLSKQI